MLGLDTARLKAEHKQLRVNQLPPTALNELLSGFSGHSLQQQDNAALMNRVDSKYLVRDEQLVNILPVLIANYSVLEIQARRLFTYQNTYFDSPEYGYFRQHHNGKLNRHKVRYRRYAETDTEFLEIKFKTNKKRTIKERVLLDRPIALASAQGRRFTEETLSPEEANTLKPSLHVNYQRATLMSETGDERLTFDFDLRFSGPGSDSQLRLKDLVIMENKRFGKLRASPFLKAAKEMRFKESSFSKYCIGCCLTQETELKINRFKPLLRQLTPFTIEPMIVESSIIDPMRAERKI